MGNKEYIDWLFSLWDERAQKKDYIFCFETGKKLKTEFYKTKLMCYSHILSKSKYPQYKMTKENVVIVHPDAHHAYENNPDKAPRQKSLKKLLMQKHIEGTL